MIKRGVCIVGAHAGCLSGLEKEREQGLDLWGLNSVYFAMWQMQISSREDFTRWFQIHPWEILLARPDIQPHLDWLATCGMPVYLNEAQSEIPTGVRYPREEVTKTIGSNYFEVNTIAYMIALAIHEGFGKIKLYGINLGPTDLGDSYARPPVEYLLGFARGRGISIWVHPNSSLLKADLYAQVIDPSYVALHKAIDLLRATSERLKYSDEKLRLDQGITALESLYLPLVRDKANGSQS